MATPSAGGAKPMGSADLICATWFERDRLHIRLETSDGQMLFELWDEDVTDALETGYLTSPRRPGATNEDWHPHAVAYAISRGILNRDGTLIATAVAEH